MSTVKIKTEPAAAATAADVQVKHEPSLSTGDIKLEQHSSDIDTKLEPESEADIKSEIDDGDDEDTNQIQSAEAPKNKLQWICKHPGCSRSFNSSSNLRRHQYEHKLQTDINILGKTYTLARESLDSRWSCPVTDCETTWKTVDALYNHIRRCHNNTMKQQQYQQQLPATRTWLKQYFLDVDDFYMNAVRYGYHATIGVFICHDCRLVPECLLIHLQQKHGHDEKSIDNSALPDSAVNTNADPNINQHINNPHLAAAITQSFQQQQCQYIIQGWLCVTSDCGYCGNKESNKTNHRNKLHQGEQLTTIPALVLRLTSTKAHTSCFFIIRIDQIPTSSNRVKRHRLDYDRTELNTQDEKEDDTDQNKTTDASSQKRQWKCEHPGCGRSFKSAHQLRTHRREHKLEVVIAVQGMAFTLTRQSSDDRWACPVSDCESMCKSVSASRVHIQHTHSTSMKQKRANSADDNNPQQQRAIKRIQYISHYLKVDVFYIGNARCGYHTTIGVFICHDCRVVPESLLTHLQQKHGFDKKSIDNALLPESARNARRDPNINQHTSNPHIASSIKQPYQWWNSDIIQGRLCVIFDCGYCHSAKRPINDHHAREHKGEQQSTVPALVLRLFYTKERTTCFLITRLDATITKNINQSNSTIQQESVSDDEEDGDELVLSDYSNEGDIH